MPGGHESPSGAFKPQTGLQSKCRVFSAARSQRFRRAGPDGLRCPASASCLGRHSHPAGRCPNSSSLYPPLAAVVAVALFSRFSDLKAPQPLRRQLPAGERGAPSPSLSVTPCPLFVAARHLPPTGGSLSKGEARSTPITPLAPFQKKSKKRALHALGSPSGRAGAKRLRGFVPPLARRSRREPVPADAVCRYGPSREKVNPKQPQLFRIYKYKNNISADIVRAKRRQF